MKDFILKYQFVIFSIVGTVIVLWQVLLPGYVLLLDWIGGPHYILGYSSLSGIVSAPSSLLLYVLQLFLPAWLVQKFIFFGMFFILFYFPLKFYPVEFVGDKFENQKQSKENFIDRIKSFIIHWIPAFAGMTNGGADARNTMKYFASLLFVFNPFVYERVLAGQWRVVVGYALMFPLVYYVLRFTHERTWRVVVSIFATLLITGMWSVHFLAVGGVIVCVYTFVVTLRYLWQRQFELLWSVGKKFLIGAVVFGVLSCYWIVPYKLQGDATLEQFGADHWQAFTTASDEYVGVVGNVVTLRGFWGESHAWVGQFGVPWDNPIIFYSIFIVILLLSLRGLRAHTKSRVNRAFLISLFILSIIFATGMSAYGLWVVNGWFAENVSFWSGFRDAQKWTGVTALIYVLWASAGVYRFKWWVLIVPIIFVPQMLFGFGGQIQTVWYPESWQSVNEVLREDEQCKVLFLPWHQYYPVKFNDGMLVANPSHRFFDCEVVAGHNTELGNIESTVGTVDNYHVIEKFIMSNNPQSEFVSEGIELLRQNDIRYIIWTNDLVDSDLYKYPFLNYDGLEKIVDKGEISLYKIK